MTKSQLHPLFHSFYQVYVCVKISTSKEFPLPGYYALHVPIHQYGFQIELPANCQQLSQKLVKHTDH